MPAFWGGAHLYHLSFIIIIIIYYIYIYSKVCPLAQTMLYSRVCPLPPLVYTMFAIACVWQPMCHSCSYSSSMHNCQAKKGTNEQAVRLDHLVDCKHKLLAWISIRYFLLIQW